jgi:hypothetical protein
MFFVSSKPLVSDLPDGRPSFFEPVMEFDGTTDGFDARFYGFLHQGDGLSSVVLFLTILDM